MARFGLIGPSYASLSPLADGERTMNLYLENIESGMGRSAAALYLAPGLSLFAALGAAGNPLRGAWGVNGRAFFAGGQSLWEVTAAGAATNRGNIGNDGNAVTMRSNGSAGNQLLICSAGALYCFNLLTNQFTPVAQLQGVPSMVEWSNGYFVAPLAGTNKFQVSNLEDGTTWNPLGVQQVSVFPENLGGMLDIFGLLFAMGVDGHSVVYYDSGASQYTPFDVIEGSFMEEGIDAPGSLCMVDNTAFWIGGNRNGAGIAWRANGYTPLRISNFGVEQTWASYPSKGSDAIGYAYRDLGHTFWMLRFPSANNGAGATWAYDVATGTWCERGYWSGQGFTGYSAHLSTCHVFAFGLHLVGDWQSGNIYSMSSANLTDNGNPLRWFRRSPPISSEQQRIFFHELQVDCQVGDGPQPPLLDGQGNARGPQMMLRWSDDGGRTWGDEHWTSAGAAGNYLQRARWTRMGQARARVYEIAGSDPIPWRILEGYLRATPGFTVPTERYQKQIAKAN